jgi:hypothetical protein
MRHWGEMSVESFNHPLYIGTLGLWFHNSVRIIWFPVGTLRPELNQRLADQHEARGDFGQVTLNPSTPIQTKAV